MRPELTDIEARVIGCLLEKEISTPDQYPLSLNALVNACNQKSNRDPVMALEEGQVQAVLDVLLKRHLVSDRSGYGSRVVKYRHLFCNTEFGKLKFTDQERGIVCELMLRGAQTPGELRSHTARLCRFADAAEVDAALHSLGSREDGPFVVKLERAPGEREARFAHLFSGTPAPPLRAREPAVSVAAPAGPPADSNPAELAARVAALEQQHAAWQSGLTALQAQVAALQDQLNAARVQVADLQTRASGD